MPGGLHLSIEMQTEPNEGARNVFERLPQREREEPQQPCRGIIVASSSSSSPSPSPPPPPPPPRAATTATSAAQSHHLGFPRPIPLPSSTSLGFRGGSPSPLPRRIPLEQEEEEEGGCRSVGVVGTHRALPPFLACGSCGSVQPVDASVDYFQIFGLKRAYEVKGDNLEGKYKDWQKKLHPDLVHTKSEDEKAFAAEQSARVIDAYRTLINPLSRHYTWLNYLFVLRLVPLEVARSCTNCEKYLFILRLEGVQVDEEKTISDPELLVEMMEIREAVDEADDSQALERIKSQVQGKLETWSNSFKQAFEKQDFDTAVASTQRMRYYERAMEEIVKKL
uniref:J domain-containing protein n=1 Tax=Ananas comosus var. bracteatus TaxID=296719 RepID=A0A6V7PB77_ANACO|nr:unnamed protein product [Ananas comosus var. bracteatus]